MEIAVDFDGTCVFHEFPEVGKDVPGAVKVLKDLVESGNKLILYTMRDGDYLEQAQSWFKDRGIDLYASQRNPTQDEWTGSLKCYAQIYIDDAALGRTIHWKAIRRLEKSQDFTYRERSISCTKF